MIGEIGFKSLLGPWGFAKFPLIHRIHEIRKDIPITFIYGENTYSIIDNSMGKRTKEIRKDSQVDVHLVKDASHHVYSDQVYQFNQLLLDTCKEVP
ncbi:(Lyso)-N-acylphosphatidylethanolamine lipase-like [Saccoglossus kowalevskii]